MDKEKINECLIDLEKRLENPVQDKIDFLNQLEDTLYLMGKLSTLMNQIVVKIDECKKK